MSLKDKAVLQWVLMIFALVLVTAAARNEWPWWASILAGAGPFWILRWAQRTAHAQGRIECVAWMLMRKDDR